MGGGLIPACIHNNKIYLLLGKENMYVDNGEQYWADFGGSKEGDETPYETAIREGTEEICGYLGSISKMKKYLREKGYLKYNVNRHTSFLFQYDYDDSLPKYFNNNLKYLERMLNPSIIKNSVYFEKSEIKWYSFDELAKLKSKSRYYFKPILDEIIKDKEKIKAYLCQY